MGRAAVKKLLLMIAVVLAVLTFAAPRLLGFSPLRLGSAVGVATGLGAKLVCSGHFVSGFSPQQARQDILSYSPAAALLTLDYSARPRGVTASLLGAGTKTARYRPGLGCTLEMGDTRALDEAHVPRVPERDARWPAGSRVDTINADVQRSLEQVMAADNAAGLQTRALLVVSDGRIVAEAYAGGADASTPLLGWSMGKSVTALLLARLDMLRGVDVQQDHLFSQWQQDARSAITLENMLHMTSGLDFDETYAPGSDATRMLFSARSASAVALASPLVFTPGQHFAYSSGTTNMLSRWLFDQLGSTVQSQLDFAYAELFRPLHMAHTVFETDASGVFIGSSYVYSSARDWARLGQLLADDGIWEGRRLLKSDWVARATAPNHSSNEPRYGYQLWLNAGGSALRWPRLPADAYAMQGNREQRVMVVPSQKVVLVRLGWSSDSYPTDEKFSTLLKAVPAASH